MRAITQFCVNIICLLSFVSFKKWWYLRLSGWGWLCHSYCSFSYLPILVNTTHNWPDSTSVLLLLKSPLPMWNLVFYIKGALSYSGSNDFKQNYLLLSYLKLVHHACTRNTCDGIHYARGVCKTDGSSYCLLDLTHPDRCL